MLVPSIIQNGLLEVAAGGTAAAATATTWCKTMIFIVKFFSLSNTIHVGFNIGILGDFDFFEEELSSIIDTSSIHKATEFGL